MKKNLIYLSFTLLIVTIAACKKDDAKKDANTGSTFTINGTTYTEYAGTYSIVTAGENSYASLTASGKTSDGKKGALVFLFPGTTKPAAGTYTIFRENADATPHSVGILAEDSVSVARSGIYSAVSGTVTVAVSSTGKLSIVLPSTTFLGNNFDNTDPKNTVSTEVNVTAVGKANEN